MTEKSTIQTADDLTPAERHSLAVAAYYSGQNQIDPRYCDPDPVVRDHLIHRWAAIQKWLWDGPLTEQPDV